LAAKLRRYKEINPDTIKDITIDIQILAESFQTFLNIYPHFLDILLRNVIIFPHFWAKFYINI